MTVRASRLLSAINDALHRAKLENLTVKEILLNKEDYTELQAHAVDAWVEIPTGPVYPTFQGIAIRVVTHMAWGTIGLTFTPAVLLEVCGRCGGAPLGKRCLACVDSGGIVRSKWTLEAPPIVDTHSVSRSTTDGAGEDGTT